MSIKRSEPCPCGSGKKYRECCFDKNYIEVPSEKKEVVLDFPGFDDLKRDITSIDSFPTHNKNGIKPGITKEQMMDLCLDEIYKIIEKKKVGFMEELVTKVIYKMDIVPTFTHREIALYMESDKRFVLDKLQICGLAGSDPSELMKIQLSKILGYDLK